jgi:hypothetical protein
MGTADADDEVGALDAGDVDDLLLQGSGCRACVGRCAARVAHWLRCRRGPRKPFVLACWLPADLLGSFFVLNNAMFFYYFSSLFDLVCRLTWLNGVTPGLIFGLRSEYATLASAFIEQTRRGVWSYIRFESEHVKNLQAGHATNLSGLNFKGKREGPRREAATWVDPDYGIPMGYATVADMYLNNVLMEGDAGYYHTEPLRGLTAPAATPGEHAPDTLEDIAEEVGEEEDEDGYGYGDRGYGFPGQIEMGDMASR